RAIVPDDKRKSQSLLHSRWQHNSMFLAVGDLKKVINEEKRNIDADNLDLEHGSIASLPKRQIMLGNLLKDKESTPIELEGEISDIL
ncbi:hypothetical protein BGZ46_005373, partial [Entomortierella lignicola]